MVYEESKSNEKPDKSEKSRRKSKSKFRRLSLAKNRSSKDKHAKEETETLLSTENENTETELDLERQRRRPGAPTIDEIELRDVPVYIICPSCQNKVVTKTDFERAKEAKCASACLCLLQ
eukprot:gene9885-10895_t